MSKKILFKHQSSSEIVVDLFAGARGERITKTAQVRLVGNSVCPPIAKALIECNYVARQFDAGMECSHG